LPVKQHDGTLRLGVRMSASICVCVCAGLGASGAQL